MLVQTMNLQLIGWNFISHFSNEDSDNEEKVSFRVSSSILVLAPFFSFVGIIFRWWAFIDCRRKVEVEK